MKPGGTLKFRDDTNQDRDFNFYQCGIPSLNSIYWAPQEIYNNFKDTSAKKFSFLHLNIRSLTKNFVAFEKIYKNLSFKFSRVCLSEASTSCMDIYKNSFFQLDGYTAVHQIRRNHKEEGGGQLHL